jgi:ATP-binding cassette subfamily F protein 3
MASIKTSAFEVDGLIQQRKELDALLMDPVNASNMELVTEYTSVKKAVDEEVERWERLSEELEQLT